MLHVEVLAELVRPAALGGAPVLVCQAAVGGFAAGWRVVEGAVSDQGVQGEDAAVDRGEECLVVALALVAFALVVGPGDRVGTQRGERGAEHGSLEPLVACVGDLLVPDRGPLPPGHWRQAGI